MAEAIGQSSDRVFMFVSPRVAQMCCFHIGTLPPLAFEIEDLTSADLTLLGRILSDRLAKVDEVHHNDSLLLEIQMPVVDLLAVLPMIRPAFLSIGLEGQTFEGRWLLTARAMARSIAKLGHSFSGVFSDPAHFDHFLNYSLRMEDRSFDVLAHDVAESVATKLAYYALHMHWIRLMIQSQDAPEYPHFKIAADTSPFSRVPAWASMSVYPMPQPTEIVNAVTAYVEWTRPASEGVQLQSPSMPSCSRPMWKVELTGLPWLCANGACFAFAPHKCAGCKDMPWVAYYCSAKCQKYDWRRHKNDCST